MDSCDKVIETQAKNWIPLTNKLSRTTRKKMKRIPVKAARQYIRQRQLIDD